MAGAVTAAAADVPHLDDGVISEILHRMPTRDAYRLAALCPQWRAVLSQPTFLCRHLSPRPLPLLEDRPYALVVQPRGRVGFTHLTLVAVDPADRVPVDVPVQPKYMDRPPPPCLLDTAGDNSVFRLLYSTGADDPAPDAADDDDAAQPLAVAAPDLPVSSEVQVEHYVVFFERTVPMLGISIVASHGRLLLSRSRSRFYICDPAANRWLALPPSTIAPVSVTNSGLYYDMSTGRLAFTVVLLGRRRRRRVLVETFRSAIGMWEAREVPAQGVARCLGAASPGIHVGTCFYWLSRRRGRILRFDAAAGRASMLREPPEAEWSNGRVGRSLGSVSGARLRLCTFDICGGISAPMLPLEEVEGVHGVWVMERPSWRRVHEAVVEAILTYYFNMTWNHEKPVDFAGACGGFIVVDKFHRLLRYDLEIGSKVELASLKFLNWRLGALYTRYHAFPFFR